MKYLLGLLLFITPTLHAYERTYEVQASGETAVPVEVIWDVLTDYENADKFVHVITSSTLETPIILSQTIRSGWWFFKKDIDLRLQIAETDFNNIVFYSIGDTSRYKINYGRWEISQGSGTIKNLSLSISLTAKIKLLVPSGIVRSVLNKEIEQYLEDILREINRRNENGKL